MLYHTTYKVEVHPEGITKEEAISDPDRGACTAVLVGSLIYPEDGSYSVMFASLDGRTGKPLSSNEIWKAWFMLSKHLSDSKDLQPNKRELCENVFRIVSEAMSKI